MWNRYMFQLYAAITKIAGQHLFSLWKPEKFQTAAFFYNTISPFDGISHRNAFHPEKAAETIIVQFPDLASHFYFPHS